MDAVLQELIKALPWGFVIIALRYLDIKEKSDERRERDGNSKEKSMQDRETAQYVAKTYADAINTLAKSVSESSFRMEKSIAEFREAVSKQYESMGITKDLLDLAKQELARHR